MSQEIDRDGVKVPAADWEATPESIKGAWQEVVRQCNERLARLEAENEQLRQQVAELAEKQRRNSKNSSQPPSRDGFGAKQAKGGGENKQQRKPLKLTRIEGKRERELKALTEQLEAASFWQRLQPQHKRGVSKLQGLTTGRCRYSVDLALNG